MLKYYQLKHPLKVQLEESLVQLSAEIENQIEMLWQKESVKKGKQLFNGFIVSVVRMNDSKLVLRRAEYRHFVAQRLEPNLYAHLKIQPLAVSGLMFSGQKLIFGKRAEFVNQDPGCWELVPSGGVTPDLIEKYEEKAFHEQLMLEMEEELGIKRSQVSSLNATAVIEDTIAHVFDVVISAQMSAVDTPLQVASTEYSDFQQIELKNLFNFLNGEAKSAGISPVSMEILKQGGLF